MNIELNKKYVTRRGLIVTCVHVEKYARFECRKGKVSFWTDLQGRHYSDKESSRDIIKEYQP